MREAILEKLQLHLDKGIKTEADCVYLLAQIRKFLEQQNIEDFWNLRMCANWALHSTLDDRRNRTVGLILEEFNDFLIDAGKRKSYDLERHPALKDKLLFITSLRDELKAFLTFCGINSDIYDDRTKLDEFLGLFGSVIEDTPLVCKAAKPLFNEIIFSKRKTVLNNDLWPSSLYWTIKKNDGVTLRIRIENKTIQTGIIHLEVQSFVYIENQN